MNREEGFRHGLMMIDLPPASNRRGDDEQAMWLPVMGRICGTACLVAAGETIQYEGYLHREQANATIHDLAKG